MVETPLGVAWSSPSRGITENLGGPLSEHWNASSPESVGCPGPLTRQHLARHFRLAAEALATGRDVCRESPGVTHQTARTSRRDLFVDSLPPRKARDCSRFPPPTPAESGFREVPVAHHRLRSAGAWGLG